MDPNPTKKGIKKQIPTKKGVMSARELASALKIHPTTVSRWVTRISAPTYLYAIKLAELMGTDLRGVYDLFPGPCTTAKPDYLKASSRH